MRKIVCRLDERRCWRTAGLSGVRSAEAIPFRSAPSPTGHVSIKLSILADNGWLGSLGKSPKKYTKTDMADEPIKAARKRAQAGFDATYKSLDMERLRRMVNNLYQQGEIFQMKGDALHAYIAYLRSAMYDSVTRALGLTHPPRG